MSTHFLTQGLSLGLAAAMTVYSVAHLGCSAQEAEPVNEARTTANWVNEDGEQIAMSVVDNGDGTGSVRATTTTALGEVERTNYLIPLNPDSSDRHFELETGVSGEHYLKLGKERFPIVNLEKGVNSTTGTLVLPNGTEVDFSTGVDFATGLNSGVVSVEISILIVVLGAIFLVGLCGWSILQSLSQCQEAYGSNACWSYSGPGYSGLCVGDCKKCNEGTPDDPGPTDPGDTEDPDGP